jgi:hemin uptake protein HemP
MRARPILQTVEPRRTPDSQPGPSPASLRIESLPVESQALLQGQRTVTISHNGEIYRLPETRLGKRILTK